MPFPVPPAVAESLLAIALGGAAGSLIRWRLGLLLNGVHPDLPIGTLVANLSAGFIIGASIAFFLKHPALSNNWKLFVLTGLMGGLSTFSTFSAEVTSHMQQGRFGWALAEIFVHVGGSVLMTSLGLFVISSLTT
ncbi:MULTISPECIES: fluoride efflux transporter CrcB [Burkholderiaceae]|jgi:fluoride exporter|uniref:Fluoride-specific ion channel FluC n=1 Tax=Burkholderia vietnamiensis TaxID=60552 RepID=A0AAW7TBD5_BURVI|nr:MULTISPECIES: fluoride efflux transporter CrcB [Burkholderiaceae]MDN7799427.1 fluoride efflux transporter CrcB [Burkholderia vietnamiensis]RFU44266.1 fluoride efflux transporter CrcB [Paraburkholderia sp. DHOC27]